MTNTDISIQPGSIVVGVDGSQHSDRAIHWAAEQARYEKRQLVVVCASGRPSVQEVAWSGAMVGIPAEDGRPSLARAHTIATDAVELALTHAPEIEAVALAVVGDPREVMVEASASAHLLVLGSHGRGAVRSVLLGSVSTGVVRMASCPVVVCRPTSGGESGGVIVTADGSEESLPVIEFAFAQASLRGLPLTVVHCFWDVVAAAAGFREAGGEIVSQPELDELHVLLAQSVAGFAEKYPDVAVSRLLRHGLVDEALTRRDNSWDLIVVGRHPMTGLRRTVMGSIATSVVERARGTVAVVPVPG